MTQEMQAVDEPEPAGAPVKHAREPGRSTKSNPVQLHAAKPATESSRVARATGGRTAPPKNPVIPIAVGLGAIVVIGCVIFSSGSGRPNSPAKKVEVASKVDEPPAPKLVEPPVIKPAEVKAPELKNAEVPAAPDKPIDREELAQRSLDKMNAAFKDMPSDDKDGRVALAKAFIKDFDDTIVSARVRVMLKQWTDPPPAAPATTAASGKAAALPNGAKALANLSQDAFTGGCPQPNFWNQGRTGRSIWGKKSGRTSMKAPFTLDKIPEGATTLVVNSLRHERQAPCQIIIKVNDVEIFKGVDPADTWVWTDHAFTIPAGILKAGKNEVYFENTEPNGEDSRIPWYMIYTVLVVEAPKAKQ
jgi:hypothetical protein